MFAWFARRKASRLLEDAQDARRAGRVGEAVAGLEKVLTLGDAPLAGRACLILSGITRERGDLTGTVAHLERARGFLPDEAAIAVQLGQDLRALGRHEEAVAAFDAARRCGQGDAMLERRAVRGAALSAFASGAADAGHRLGEAVDGYALDGEAWSCLAQLRADGGRTEQARAALRVLLRANRNDVEAQERWLALGEGPARAEAFARLWRPDPDVLDARATRRLFDDLRGGAAADALARVAPLEGSSDPNAVVLAAFVRHWVGGHAGDPPAEGSAFGSYVRGLVLTTRRDEEGARAALRGVEGGPFPGVAFLLGMSLDVAGDLDGAEEPLRRALAEDPEDAETLLLLAGVLRRRGDREGAEGLEGAAYRLDPVLVSPRARGRIDALADRRARVDRARAEADLTEHAGDAEARLRLADACNRLADYGAAIGAVGDPVPEGSTPAVTAALFRERGYARYGRGELEAAARDFAASVALAPADAAAHMRLGEVLAQQGRAADAEGHLDTALALGPAAFHALATRGILFSRRGDVVGAERCYRAAMRADPTAAAPHANLAVDRDKRGDLAGAERALRFATALDPDDAGTHSSHAAVLERLGRAADARPVRSRAEALTRRDLARRALDVALPPLEVPSPSPWIRESRTVFAALVAEVFGP